jgi:hypothetical protein
LLILSLRNPIYLAGVKGRDKIEARKQRPPDLKRVDVTKREFHTFFLETASDYQHSAVYKTVYKNSGILLKNSHRLTLD